MARLLKSIALVATLALAAACEDPLTVGDDYSIPERWASVSAGAEHTCAVAADGAAWCWGRMATNRLGFVSDAPPCQDDARCRRPVEVVGNLEFESISASDKFTCGVSRDTGYCWGWGWWGQLGDVNTAAERCIEPAGTAALPCSLEPLPVALGFEIVDVSAGIDYACAVTRPGDAYCWGLDQHGQLGVGFVKDSLTSPTLVAGSHEFRRVSTGHSHACALDDDGEIWCWGSNLYGRLGSGDEVDSPSPVLVVDDPDEAAPLSFVDFDAGSIHNCAISTEGAGYCWGAGVGRIGDGSDRSFPNPHRIIVPDGLESPLVQISAGDAHSCAVTEDHRLLCWGDNTFGQLGDGTTLARWTPQFIASDIGWQSVSAGANHTCAVDVDDAIWCWGQGRWSQLGNGQNSRRVIPTPIASS